jgi:acyl-CoA synthetase (AMP-forming)/AMP-acid ligase II
MDCAISAFLNDIFFSRAESPFLIDAAEGQVFSYRETLSAANRLSGFMRDAGVGAAGPAAVSMDNCPEMAQIYLAAMLLGAPILPVNPGLSAGDAAEIMAGTGAENIFVSPQVYAGLKESLEKKGRFRVHCLQPAGRKLKPHLRPYLNLDLDDFSARYPDPEAGFSASDDSILFLMPTSGTSGQPKVLEITWGSLFNNGRLFAKAMGMDSVSRFYDILPMTYLGGGL